MLAARSLENANPPVQDMGALLFITRKHPPSVGGMEQLSYHITTGLARRWPARIVKWGGSQKWLPLFVVYALAAALFTLATRRVMVIHVGDLVLAPLAVFLKWISRKPVIITAHGLDVLYPNALYQRVVPACMRRLDAVVCISHHTRQACLERGVERERTIVIPVGVNPRHLPVDLLDSEAQQWRVRWQVEPGKRILLTVGRLVPRKGVRFLVGEVLPLLRQRRMDWTYLVVGDGPERAAIGAEIERHGLQNAVRLLGEVSDEELAAAYAVAHAFVMPNVPVRGDSEGFGIVSVEARMTGLPVVASALEGITDAMDRPEDGALITPGDAHGFVAALEAVLEADLRTEDRLARRASTVERFSWERLIDRYEAAFLAVAGDRKVGAL